MLNVKKRVQKITQKNNPKKQFKKRVQKTITENKYKNNLNNNIMKTEQTTKEMIKEIDQVISFIDEWRRLNPYNPDKLEIYNKKFRTDLKEFFDKSNFKHEKIEFYKG